MWVWTAQVHLNMDFFPPLAKGFIVSMWSIAWARASCWLKNAATWLQAWVQAETLPLRAMSEEPLKGFKTLGTPDQARQRAFQKDTLTAQSGGQPACRGVRCQVLRIFLALRHVASGSPGSHRGGRLCQRSLGHADPKRAGLRFFPRAVAASAEPRALPHSHGDSFCTFWKRAWPPGWFCLLCLRGASLPQLRGGVTQLSGATWLPWKWKPRER